MKYRPMATLPVTQALEARRGISLSCRSIGLLVAVAEATMIVVGSAFGPMAYGCFSGIDMGGSHRVIGAGVLSSLLYVTIARSKGFYRLPMLIDPARHLRRIATASVYVLASITAILFLSKIGSDFSRGAFLGFATLMLGLCVLTRLGAADLIRALLARDGVLGRPAVLIGQADELASLTCADMLRQFGVRDVGRIVLDPAPFLGQAEYVRSIEEALRIARLKCAQEFVVAQRFDQLESLTALESALRISPLPVRLVPDRIFRSVVARHPRQQEDILHLIDLQRAPLGIAEQFAKRLVDLVGASISIIVLAPILLGTALAIKLDSPGPIIFRQRRNGFNEREFVIFKFRTMAVHDDGPSIVQAKPGDRRVTRIGRLLRRSSIDELPQLVNVLKGEMSLVGPRPHALAHDDQYKAVIRDYCLRHHMKPGISGWAQVNGLRGETAEPQQMERRIEFDRWYIDNWSLSLDLKILLRTCFETLGHNAY